ncbi:MAG: glycosyltransferase [Thermodesulfobacteriota bacterium]
MHRPKPIKVLQLGSPTGLFGAERWILALIKHLDPKKIESIVGVIKDDPRQSAPLCQEAEKLRFETHLFGARGKVCVAAINQIHKYIKENKIDILHTHFYKTDLLGLLATRGTGCKIISTPHGWDANADFKLWCYEALDRLLFCFMHGVAPLSHNLHQGLQRFRLLPKNKIHLIRNGVDLSEIATVSTASDEILSLKSSGVFLLGYVGRLAPGKGLDTLLYALSLLKQEPVELVIIGEGPERETLESISKALSLGGKVHFLGFRQDRISLMKGFDAFVLPSLQEGTPRCLMESMASRVPSIASNIPGCKELIKDGETGLLFEVANPSALAQKIQEISACPELRASLADKAMALVHEHYSAARMARDYETLYTSLIQPSQRDSLSRLPENQPGLHD